MNNKPKLNVELLKRIVRHLREEPKRYYQSQWGRQVDPTEAGAPACGTQGCIAGWAVFLSVPQVLWPTLHEGNAFNASGYGYPGASLATAPATKAAQELLGLTDDEAVAMFSSINQAYTRGKSGVKEAAAKVRLLVKDRAAFVRKYL